MTAAHPGTRTLDRVAVRPSPLVGVLLSAATVVLVVSLALLPLLTPPFVHAALDVSGSAGLLGLDAATTRAISDRAVADLVSPAGSFEAVGADGAPFFDPSERSHLRDARTLLWLALLAGLAGATFLGVALIRHRPSERVGVWRAIARGGSLAALGAVALGVVGVVAFGALFTLFHEIAFPAGNWSFDPATQRLVRLYPVAFWQLASGALGVLVIAIGIVTWWLARGWARPADAGSGAG